MQDHARKPLKPTTLSPKGKVKTIGVTAFKAKSLALIEEVASGRTQRLVLTRRGKPVAELTAIRPARRKRFVSSYGFLKGMLKVAPGVDLTKPMPTEWNADKGILYWGKDGPVYADDDEGSSS
jgi:antitoxin (DNA-binding transcriptional repressor) of toxin-antitoxin stability system